MNEKTKQMSLLRRRRELESLFRPMNNYAGTLVTEFPNGAIIQTAGGHIGLITGRHTKNAVQIKLLSGEFVGEYDWISKLAKVIKVEQNKSKS
jgi:hypothetical protein